MRSKSEVENEIKILKARLKEQPIIMQCVICCVDNYGCEVCIQKRIEVLQEEIIKGETP